MKLFILIFITFFLCTSVFAETDLSSSKLSDKKKFQVSYTSKLDPIEINNLHAWIIYIENAKGNAVHDAEVNVIGGMPEHNHGLPTKPQVTKNLGDGRYLLEGMKFHMLGWWTVTVSIMNENATDTVTFNLKL